MDQKRPIFYSFRRCPYAMRARLALAVSAQRVELREIILRDKPPSMLAASPKATVPVLILADRTVLEESLDIMQWALAQNDPEGWCVPAATDIKALIDINDGPFKHHLDRYKYPNRYDNIIATDERDSALQILLNLNDQLSVTGWLLGEKCSLADMALLPFIRQFANTDRDWFDVQNLPHLQKWLSNFLHSSLFLSIMNKYELWEENTMGINFPD